MKSSLFTVIVFLLACGVCAAQRLPGGAIPEHYTLTFAINFQNDTFNGDETIELKLTKPEKTITLNALEVDFDEITVTAGGTTQKADLATDEKNETATFTVANTLPAGPASLHIKFI